MARVVGPVQRERIQEHSISHLQKNNYTTAVTKTTTGRRLEKEHFTSNDLLQTRVAI